MVVGSQLQDKIHEKWKVRAVRTYMVSVVRLPFQAKLCNSQCVLTHGAHVETSVCTAMSTARRLHQMDGSAVLLRTSRTCDHHTRISGCVLMLTTIHAMVERDNSFDTQRMLAHGIQAAQTMYAIQTHPTEGCVRVHFTISRTYYHDTRNVRFSLHSLPRTQPLIRRCSKLGSLLAFKTPFYVVVLSSLDSHVAELRTKHVCVQTAHRLS